jgi:hypothetical protein
VLLAVFRIRTLNPNIVKKMPENLPPGTTKPTDTSQLFCVQDKCNFTNLAKITTQQGLKTQLKEAVNVLVAMGHLMT